MTALFSPVSTTSPSSPSVPRFVYSEHMLLEQGKFFLSLYVWINANILRICHIPNTLRSVKHKAKAEKKSRNMS